MAPMVVTVVMSTDRATSPFAMYVHRLLACHIGEACMPYEGGGYGGRCVCTGCSPATLGRRACHMRERLQPAHTNVTTRKVQCTRAREGEFSCLEE
eukprot:73556-Prymnesium_polylepis.3